MKATFNSLVIRRLPLLIMLFILVAILSMVGLNFVPPQYLATARILIKRNVQDVTKVDNDSAAAISMVLVRNQLERLRSVTLFSSALKRLGMDSDPNSENFKKYYLRLQVKQLPASTVLQIQVKGKSPETIAKITNTLVECLMEENQNLRKEEVQQIVTYLTEKFQEIKDERQELSKYSSKTVPVKSKPVTSPVWQDTSRKLALYQTDYQTIQKKIPVADFNRASYLFSENNILIKNYQQAINGQLTSLAVLLPNPKTNATTIRKLQAEIWREKVKTANLIQSTLTQLQFSGKDWEELTYAYLRIIEMKGLQTKLQKNPTTSVATTTPAITTTLTTAGQIAVDKQLDSLMEMEKVLIEKLTDLKVNAGLTDCEIQWVDKAIVPTETYFPTLPLSIVISIMAGLGVCLFVVYISLIREEIRG